jgi:RNA polymerase primary sigma factor
MIIPYTKLTKAEVTELVAKAQAGDTGARDKIVLQHLRLIVKLATKIARQYSKTDLIDDFIQGGVAGIGGNDGTGGLLRAIEKFEPSKGLAFSTYAYPWIMQGIRNVVGQHVPAGRRVGNSLSLIRKTASMLEGQLARPPTNDEIRAAYRARGVKVLIPTDAAIDRALSSPIKEFSIEADHDENHHGHGHGFTRRQAQALTSDAPSEDEIIDHIDSQRTKSKLADAIADLTPQEATAISGRFGLGGGPPKTQRELATILKIPQQRVAELEALAVEKLRHALAS